MCNYITKLHHNYKWASSSWASFGPQRLFIGSPKSCSCMSRAPLLPLPCSGHPAPCPKRMPLMLTKPVCQSCQLQGLPRLSGKVHYSLEGTPGDAARLLRGENPDACPRSVRCKSAEPAQPWVYAEREERLPHSQGLYFVSWALTVFRKDSHILLSRGFQTSKRGCIDIPSLDLCPLSIL